MITGWAPDWDHWSNPLWDPLGLPLQPSRSEIGEKRFWASPNVMPKVVPKWSHQDQGSTKKPTVTYHATEQHNSEGTTR